MNYWERMYGTRSNEFIEGVIAGIEAFAVWKDGEQVVGIMQQKKEDAIQEAKAGLGWKEK